MHLFPKGGLLGRAVALGRRISAFRIPIHAANTSFFLILSVFPSLLLLLGLLRYTELDVLNLLRFLEGLLPAALLPDVELFIVNTYNHASRAMVGLSALSALWSASRGVFGLLTGLNAIYGVNENRGYFYTRTISFLYTFLFLMVLLLTLVLHVFGTQLLELLAASPVPILRFLATIVDLRFFLLVFLQTGVFTALFMVLPNQKNTLRDSLPGAFLASIGWLIFSYSFSVYVEYFSKMSNIYGSVYTVPLSMLWLYFCIAIVFYGGVLNRLLTESPSML